MTDGVKTWIGKVNEDGSFSVLARIVALSGTGTTVRDVDGPCVKQSDVSAITCRVYDLGTDKDAATGTEITPAPTVSVGTSVYDTLQTPGWPTSEDPAGYNFRFDVASTYVPNGGRWYQLEFKFTLADGGIAWLRVKVKTVPVIQS